MGTLVFLRRRVQTLDTSSPPTKTRGRLSQDATSFKHIVHRLCFSNRLPHSPHKKNAPASIMRAISSLPLLFGAASACVRFTGYITHSPIFGSTMDPGSQVVDNGEVVCKSDWGLSIDGGNNFAYGCKAGYSMSVSQSGQTAWYTAHGTNFSWNNRPKSEKYCCAGACEDKKGVGISCTDYWWDHSEYC